MTDSPKTTKKPAAPAETTPAVNDDQDATAGTAPAPQPKADREPAEPKGT